MLSEAGEPHWITVDAPIALNRSAVALTGEPHAVLSPGLLASAQAKPINRWAYEGETDVVRLAVSLMAGVAQNHPFQQGNKRTAFEGGLSFLGANGVTVNEDVDSKDLADAFVDLIAHRTTEREFAERLRPHVRPRG